METHATRAVEGSRAGAPRSRGDALVRWHLKVQLQVGRVSLALVHECVCVNALGISH